MADASRNQALESLKGLLASGEYSDLCITCGVDQYRVHKSIVCVRADFFARAIRFEGQESQNSTVDLPEDDPAIVKLLVQYLYEAEYDPGLVPHDATFTRNLQVDRPESTSNGDVYSYDFPHKCLRKLCGNLRFVCPHHQCGVHCRSNCKGFICTKCNPPLPGISGGPDQLLTHAKMYEIADKYDVIGLKELCKVKFKEACRLFWSAPEFEEAASYALLTTPEDDKGFRDIVSKTLSDHLELTDKPDIEVLLLEYNGLAFGVLQQLKKKGSDLALRAEKGTLSTWMEIECR